MTPYPPQAPLLRAVRGPIMLMLVGALFALDHLTEYRFSQTWPLLLIVLGLLLLIARMAPQPQPQPPARTLPPASGPGGAL